MADVILRNIAERLYENSPREVTDNASVAAIRHPAAAYNETRPFHPSGDVPECPFEERAPHDNPAYDAIRAAFLAQGWDVNHFGTADWNPLGHLVTPGDTVLLKPNLVVDHHPRDPAGLTYTVTHGSLIRAVADYVAIALRGNGRIVVADAPQTDSSFEQIAKITGLVEIAEFYRRKGIQLSVLDLRAEEWKNEGGVITDRRSLPGDPRGYSVVDIGQHSAFFGFPGEGRYYGADYDTAFVNNHHSGVNHRYSFANSALECDVFINLPKLKTHKKGGLTCSLKNLVGINGNKNYLPHHTVGSPRRGGDQFPNERAASRLEHSVAAVLRATSLKFPQVGIPALKIARATGKRLFGAGSKTVRSGNWFGNTTVWRMVLDMNRILLYWNPKSRELDPNRSRKYLSIVDAVIAGEGDGPMDPDPKAFGVVLAGTNPAHVDAAAAVLMGFDPDLIPTICEAFAEHDLPIASGSWETVPMRSNVNGWRGKLGDVEVTDAFKPHFGWRGHIERTPLTRER